MWKHAALIVAMSLTAGLAMAGTNITLDGNKLLVNGDPYKIKGVNYSPVHIGTKPSWEPYGDYFTADFSNVWSYDIGLMRDMGVNTIKLYAGNPGANAGAPGSGGNWKPFLDELWNGGDRPIRVMMTSYIEGSQVTDGGSTFQQYKTDWTNMVASTASHPAVLGYTIGNEMHDGQTSNSTFWNNFGELFDTARAAADANSTGHKILTTALVDQRTTVDGVPDAWDPIVRGENSGKLDNLDAWTINVYRGADFGGAGNSVFDQYENLMQTLGVDKPMIVGEFGVPHSTRPEGIYGTTDTANAIALNDGSAAAALTQMLQSIADDMDDGAGQVTTGGFVFGFVDEWWKAGDPSDHFGGPNGTFLGDNNSNFPGGYYDEAWFGLTEAIGQEWYDGTNPGTPTRELFETYYAALAFYNQYSHLGGEAYLGVIPEPASVMLLLAGTGLLLTRRHRAA